MAGISDDKAPENFFINEAERCLECNFICQKCVDVCPNRANIFVSLPEGGVFTQQSQIVHIDGYCNECGNCGTFCPWEGNPYRDKPTVFSGRVEFDNSENPGWLLDGDTLVYRFPPEAGLNGGHGMTGVTSFRDGKVDSALKANETAVKFFTLMENLYEQRPTLFGPMEE